MLVRNVVCFLVGTCPSADSSKNASTNTLQPNGDSASDGHCLGGCSGSQGTAPLGSLWRGTGHVPVMKTRPGVNGLHDMGGNVWEWVDSGNGDERITRGGSWWYNASRQLANDIATKPKDTRVGYIGFRWVATF